MLVAALALLSLPEAPNETSFVRALVGCWQASGQMVGAKLAQYAKGHLVLNQSFVQLEVWDNPHGPRDRVGKGYEAIYLIGYDKRSQQFVFNLFDTFGVFAPPIPGLGKLSGTSVDFVFAYAPKPFRARISFEPGFQRWTMEQREVEPDGKEQPFAIKNWRKSACI